MSDTNLTTNDINELAAFACPLHEAGVPKVQMDTAHAVGLIRLACEGHDAAAEITALRSALSAKDEEVKRLREAVLAFQCYGCPVCHGDCGSANPPVGSCPMQLARAALSPTAAREAKEDNA